ncbi:MAG: hypothetical protein ACOCWE_06915 [Bacillota bacterium]
MQNELVADTLQKLNRMALEQIREHNYHQALNFFQQSLYLEESLGLKAAMAQSFYNLASTYILLEEYQEAQKKIKFAKTLFKEIDSMKDYEKALDIEMQLLDFI